MPSTSWKLSTSYFLYCRISQSILKHSEPCKVAIFFYAVWKRGKQKGDRHEAGGWQNSNPGGLADPPVSTPNLNLIVSVSWLAYAFTCALSATFLSYAFGPQKKMPKLGEKILKPSLSIGTSPSEANSTKKCTPITNLDNISRKCQFLQNNKYIEWTCFSVVSSSGVKLTHSLSL